MNFDKLSQAAESIQPYHHFFQTIRIWSRQPEKLLYESQNEKTSETFSTDASAFQGATLSINSVAFKVNLAVTIDGHPCNMELIQQSVKEKETSVLQSMQRLIITDPLTKLYNRRFIDEQLPRELSRAFQSDEPVSFLYADIDLFKQINDRHGHAVGDCVLRDVANIFRHQIRSKSEWVARYGGDEFLFCLPEIGPEASAQIADRIRRVIAQNNFQGKNKAIRISCSVGVRTLYPSDGINTLTQIIGLLDEKLYKAKASGRNRVIV